MRRRRQRRKEAAGAEPKTKTPHNDVGNKNTGTNSKAMSRALRLVVTQSKCERLEIPNILQSYLKNYAVVIK